MGKQSLLIACSHFGNTKETVDIATLVFCFPFMLELSEMVVTFRFEWYLIVVN
ncbi:hypothetical protein [Velocimicrobium porci]|uniref:hypothetical protein n=1 Tax=Velocimicrobium porci TaxID=2606634 RepID=UPI0012B35472|nr:hypothetical protein [Velocimicrobium porci]